jgi:hypothetical protein
MPMSNIAHKLAGEMEKAERLYESAVSWRELEAAQEAVSLALTNVSSDSDWMYGCLKGMADQLDKRQADALLRKRTRKPSREKTGDTRRVERRRESSDGNAIGRC